MPGSCDASPAPAKATPEGPLGALLSPGPDLGLLCTPCVTCSNRGSHEDGPQPGSSPEPGPRQEPTPRAQAASSPTGPHLRLPPACTQSHRPREAGSPDPRRAQSRLRWAHAFLAATGPASRRRSVSPALLPRKQPLPVRPPSTASPSSPAAAGKDRPPQATCWRRASPEGGGPGSPAPWKWQPGGAATPARILPAPW